jgi:hypothetical protein
MKPPLTAATPQVAPYIYTAALDALFPSDASAGGTGVPRDAFGDWSGFAPAAPAPLAAGQPAYPIVRCAGLKGFRVLGFSCNPKTLKAGLPRRQVRTCGGVEGGGGMRPHRSFVAVGPLSNVRTSARPHASTPVHTRAGRTPWC